MCTGKLAVVMTVYNEDINYLTLAIDSTLKALDKVNNAKLFIYVDNLDEKLSVDVRLYLESLKSPSVNVIFSDDNIGLAMSLNYVIEKYCRDYDYIGRMDSDDICDQNRFCKQLEIIKRDDIDILGCNGVKIDEYGNIIGCITNNVTPNFRYGNEMIHPSLVFKRVVFQKLSGYRNYSCAQDYDFLCRAQAKNFKLKNMQDELIKYRIRSGSIGQRRKKEQLIYKIRISESFRKGNILTEVVNISGEYKFYDVVEAFKGKNTFLYRFLSLFSVLHVKKYVMILVKRYALSDFL